MHHPAFIRLDSMTPPRKQIRLSAREKRVRSAAFLPEASALRLYTQKMHKAPSLSLLGYYMHN